MKVLEAINSKSRIDEARDRLKATREKANRSQSKLRGSAQGAAGSAHSSMAEARAAARGAAREARKSWSSAGKAVRHARRDSGKRARRAGRAGRKAYVEARVGTARRLASRRERSSKLLTGAAGAIGAAGAYFLDPDSGARRRDATRDRAAATARRVSERLRRQAERGEQISAPKAPPSKVNGDQQGAERVSSQS